MKRLPSDRKKRRILSLPPDRVLMKCRNGVFIGRKEDGIEEYKGIPFALPPTGERRWKAPSPAPDSSRIFSAFKFGKSPIQTKCRSERASYYIQGEDCLYLNIWMGDKKKYGNRRPVMVFLHGGAYGWGGTSDPLYNGMNFARNHPEVVLITTAYRTGIMGFIDLSYLKGGEDFPDAPNLGILDQIEALRWIKKNCAAFGGDPENVTVFGESAGAGSVSLLPLIPQAKGLFRRIIAESGSVGLTYSKRKCKALTDRLMKVSGLDSMDELMSLSEDELKILNESLNDYTNFPQKDGKLIPVNPFSAFWKGKSADVDMMIGTNADETNYWIGEVGGVMKFRFSIPVKFENDVRSMEQRDKRRVREFMRTRKCHPVWRMSEFYTELMFRLPAIFQAGEHAAKGGRSYMYYWTIHSEIPYYRACHATELAYVFGNTEETIFTGKPADQAYSDMIQQMWVNFATCGDPSLPELEWPTYDKVRRSTMILSESPHVEDDPNRQSRCLLYPLLKYQINPAYTELSLNTLFVWKTAVIGTLLASGLIVGGTALVLSLLRKNK